MARMQNMIDSSLCAKLDDTDRHPAINRDHPLGTLSGRGR
jgi:hypothetical protein